MRNAEQQHKKTEPLRIAANKASCRAWDNPSVITHSEAYELNRQALLKSPNIYANHDWHRGAMDSHVKYLCDADKLAHKAGTLTFELYFTH